MPIDPPSVPGTGVNFETNLHNKKCVQGTTDSQSEFGFDLLIIICH